MKRRKRRTRTKHWRKTSRTESESGDDADGGSATSDLFSAYELEGGQQFAGILLPSENREPGEAGRRSQGGLAHTSAHELIRTLDTVLIKNIYLFGMKVISYCKKRTK